MISESPFFFLEEFEFNCSQLCELPAHISRFNLTNKSYKKQYILDFYEIVIE